MTQITNTSPLSLLSKEQVSITIGEFTIWSQSALGDPTKVYIWRNSKYGSEGGDFSKEKLNEMLNEFWDKEF